MSENPSKAFNHGMKAVIAQFEKGGHTAPGQLKKSGPVSNDPQLKKAEIRSPTHMVDFRSVLKPTEARAKFSDSIDDEEQHGSLSDLSKGDRPKDDKGMVSNVHAVRERSTNSEGESADTLTVHLNEGSRKDLFKVLTSGKKPLASSTVPKAPVQKSPFLEALETFQNIPAEALMQTTSPGNEPKTAISPCQDSSKRLLPMAKSDDFQRSISPQSSGERKPPPLKQILPKATPTGDAKSPGASQTVGKNSQPSLPMVTGERFAQQHAFPNSTNSPHLPPPPTASALRHSPQTTAKVPLPPKPKLTITLPSNNANFAHVTKTKNDTHKDALESHVIEANGTLFRLLPFPSGIAGKPPKKPLRPPGKIDMTKYQREDPKTEPDDDEAGMQRVSTIPEWTEEEEEEREANARGGGGWGAEDEFYEAFESTRGSSPSYKNFAGYRHSPVAYASDDSDYETLD